MHGKVGTVDRIEADDAARRPARSRFEAGRYHSLAAIEPLPEALVATARDRDGEVMALRHRDIPHLHGVQFHPESVLTPAGDVIARNFLAMGSARVISETIDRLLAGRRAERRRHRGGGRPRDARRGRPRADRRPAGRAARQGRDRRRDRRRGARDARARRRGAARAATTSSTPRAPAATARGTFNISTTAALVAAACGCAVAKHGNRAASSRSGSADVLEALGVPIALTPEQAARMIERHGFGYLHAPDHHPAMRHAGPVRRSLGVRTVFNLLGPLTNPAGARRQLIGVYAPQWVEPMAQALAALGCEHGMVVHGQPGIDELSPCGATTRRDRARRRRRRSASWTRASSASSCARSPTWPAATRSATPRSRSRCSRGEAGPAADATALNAAAATRGGGARGRSRRRCGTGARGTALRSGNGDVVGAARRGEGSGMSYLEGIGAWTRERLEERRETRSLAASLLHTGAKSVIAEVKRSLARRRARSRPGADPATRRAGLRARPAPRRSPCSPRRATSAAPTPTSPPCARPSTSRSCARTSSSTSGRSPRRACTAPTRSS